MISILLLTHENFGAAMINSAKLIVGDLKQVEAFGLNRGDDIAYFSNTIKDKIKKLDDGDGVLIFADLFGASPYNATAIASKNTNSHYRCIAGFNFPMLLEAITLRHYKKLDDLTQKCIEAGHAGIKELFNEMKNI